MRRVLALVAVLVVAGCSSTPGVVSVGADPFAESSTTETANTGALIDNPDIGTLEWDSCTGTSSPLVALECATLTVPLDYDAPDGETIDIAVARTATARVGARIGSLLFNPGGPGGSGIEFLASAAAVVPSALADRFDLVAFDPRGVGASSAVDCAVEFDDDVALLSADDDAGWEALVADANGLADTCSAGTLDLSARVGTNNAARDLDSLREALGDEQLSYVGFSYGTRLGATYAELFPDRVRALVLDGAVKPTDDLALIGLEQGPGFDRALERFAATCDADGDCALAEAGPALEVYTDLVDEIAAAGSFSTDDPTRVLTAGELQLGVVAALYSTQLWPVLADALAMADSDQDGTLLQVLADSYLGRRSDGSYDNSQVAGFAINCADDPRRPPADQVRLQAELSAQASVYFADFIRASTGCIGSADPIDPIIIGPADGAAAILVIGTTGDPATPYEWAVEMAEVLTPGVLYTVEAEGHTAFLSVPCVEDVVVDYLVRLVAPGDGSSCAAPPSDDVFAPQGEGEFDQIIGLFDCLRDNGVDLPEITIGDLLADPTGELLAELLGGLDPTDPAFLAATLACVSFIPGS